MLARAMLAEKEAAFAFEAEHHCSACPIGKFCLPLGLDNAELNRLDRVMRVSRPVRARQYLYRAGEPLRMIYAVRAGCFKSTTVDCDGYEQIIGFHLPGELMGLDSIHSGLHPCDAVALTLSKVCVFPFDALIGMASNASRLLMRLLQLLSKDVVGNVSVIGSYTAEERLAAFLLALAVRVHPRGELSLKLTLPMSRSEIANYLRIAGETLSRNLTRFQDNNLIRLQHRNLEIADLKGLQYLARRVPAFSP